MSREAYYLIQYVFVDTDRTVVVKSHDRSTMLGPIILNTKFLYRVSDGSWTQNGISGRAVLTIAVSSIIHKMSIM